MAKAAWGLADEIVSTVLLAFDGPIIISPAMNADADKARRAAEHRPLKADGMVIIDPVDGHWSCGEVGAGTMAEPGDIFNVIAEQLTAKR